MPELLTLKEAAAELKVCTATLTNWINNGQLRAVKMGHLWRIHQEDLEKFLDERASS